jgi:hypothetical protein
VDSQDEIIGICLRCGYEFTHDDEDPHVPGLAYCPNDGRPLSYDR